MLPIETWRSRPSGWREADTSTQRLKAKFMTIPTDQGSSMEDHKLLLHDLQLINILTRQKTVPLWEPSLELVARVTKEEQISTKSQ